MKKLLFIGLFLSIVLLGGGLVAILSEPSYLKPVWPKFITQKSLPVQIDEEIIPVDQSIKILFGGDLMFDRYIRTLAERQAVAGQPVSYDFIFSDLEPLFAEYDLVVANLEGPVTDFDSISQGSEVGSTANYIFTFSPEIIPTLQKHNFVVNLGNNHLENFGAAGVDQTKQYLGQASIPWFGQLSAQYPNETLVLEQAGMKLAFINYNQFGGGSFEDVVAAVAAHSATTDVQIVYTHWDNEYWQEPAAVTVSRAEQLVAAGADLIIGSHPHVVQTVTVIDGVPVYYSLGNFVFDQYFDQEVTTGLLTGFEVSPTQVQHLEDVEVKLLPTGETVVNVE